MSLLSTSAVSDWLTTSPGVFVLVAALALLLSVAGPVFSRGITATEDAVRSRWGRARGSGSAPRGIRIIPADEPGRGFPPADVEA